MIETRLEKLRQAMPADTDAVLLCSGPNRFYFTGMHSSAGTLLVTREQAYFLIDFRYIELARRTVKSAEVLLQEKLGEQLAELVRRHRMGKIAVETSYMTVGERTKTAGWLPGVEISEDPEVDAAILRLRSIKDQGELEAIRGAQKITDAAFSYILGVIRPGMTEKQVALGLEYKMKELGADGLAFDTIAVSGANSSLPHGVPGDKPIEKGDFLTMDFGARYMGYCSDMTRTVAVGYATDEMQKVYQTVLDAQLAAIERAKAGADCFDVDAAARDLINGAGYTGCFGHGTGHSLGLEIHEDPRFSPGCHEICRPGLVMTVEPGIYLEGKFGCRIEDMVFIDENGTINLTNSTKELSVL